MLSCSCSDDPAYFYLPPDDFTTLDTNKRRRCCSCKALINIGATVLKFSTWRNPETDIEERIYGDEVPLANRYMCEACGDHFFNLSELGFCIDIHANMFDLLKERAELYT